MTWQSVAAFLACARIGAVHSVIFAGYSAESLRDRVQDCKSRVVIVSDERKRGGKTIPTKATVDVALKECPLVEHVLVFKRTGNSVPWTDGRDKWWHEETAKVPNYCPPEVMASEDPLFILYVSPPILGPNVKYLPDLLDLWLHRKAQGSRAHHWRLPPLCRLDCQVCVRCPPRR
jgi:acetyl-CoA synthetase